MTIAAAQANRCHHPPKPGSTPCSDSSPPRKHHITVPPFQSSLTMRISHRCFIGHITLPGPQDSMGISSHAAALASRPLSRPTCAFVIATQRPANGMVQKLNPISINNFRQNSRQHSNFSSALESTFIRMNRNRGFDMASIEAAWQSFRSFSDMVAIWTKSYSVKCTDHHRSMLQSCSESLNFESLPSNSEAPTICCKVLQGMPCSWQNLTNASNTRPHNCNCYMSLAAAMHFCHPILRLQQSARCSSQNLMLPMHDHTILLHACTCMLPLEELACSAAGCNAPFFLLRQCSAFSFSA